MNPTPIPPLACAALGALLSIASPSPARAAVDLGAMRGKHILFVMNYHEADEARKEVPPRPALIKMKEDVLVILQP